MIKRYTKKPVTIEAMQFDGTSESADAIRNWATMPDGMTAECARDTHGGKCLYLGIRTLEGPMRVSTGDWIIKGVKGEFYPCKPDVFTATYSEGEDAAKLQSERDELAAEVDGLRTKAARWMKVAGFFASVIKSGEKWSETCEREFNAARTAGGESQ